MEKQEINRLYYIEKDYSGLKDLLKNSSDPQSFNILGKIYLSEMNLKEAYKYFYKANNIYECGYCHFLNGNLKEALNFFKPIKNLSSAVNWSIFLIEIIEEKTPINTFPTYFQIRNFYEQDLENLFRIKNYDFIKKIINKNKYIENFNREIFKYTGRVLLYNDKIDSANIFLKKSLDIFYNDPETHFLLGELYLKMNNTEKAKNYFQNAEKVNNGYAPAIMKLKNL